MAPCDWIKEWAKNFGVGTMMALIFVALAAAIVGIVYGISWLYSVFGVTSLIGLVLPIAVVMLSLFGRHILNS